MRTVRKVHALEVVLGEHQQTIETALQEIGLSQHEIALYRMALSLGPRPASTLAKSIRVQRTRVYDLLSALQSRGLMEMVERNCVRHYSATSPDHLLSLVRERKKLVESQLDLLEKAIPSLFGQGEWSTSSIESKTVRGVRLVREALEEALNSAHESLLAIGDIEQVLRTNVGMSRWAQQFRDKRVRLGIALRIAVQGPPDLLEEKALLRETLSSPDIPKGILALATNDTVLFLEQNETMQATRIDSKTFCLILNGFYNSLLHAAQCIA